MEPDVEPAPESETIAETVVLDESGVKITVTGLEKDSLMGADLQLLIENNSGANLTVQARNTSINGYMVEGIMSVDIADGKKANDTLSFMDSDLEACGIETIADIELSFYIFYTDDWETYLESDLVQLKTSAAEGFTYTYDDSGTPVYEGNNVRIIAKSLMVDDILGPEVVLYIENNSDRAVIIQTRDVSVNGFMIDGLLSCEVTPGKRAVDGISFWEDDLEANGIEEIENVELVFSVVDADSFSTIAESDSIILTFE